MVNDSTYWTTEISPTTFAKGLGLKELWQKKYLIWLFIKRDITVQFKQTIFGMGWYFISPLFSMFMYIIVFGRIAGIPTDDIPQPVFYLSGICLRGRYVSIERRIVRESLFPASCIAGFCCHIEDVPLLFAVRYVRHGLSALCVQGRTSAADLVFVPFPGIDSYDPVPGAWVGIDCLVAYYQVS